MYGVVWCRAGKTNLYQEWGWRFKFQLWHETVAGFFS